MKMYWSGRVWVAMKVMSCQISQPTDFTQQLFLRLYTLLCFSWLSEWPVLVTSKPSSMGLRPLLGCVLCVSVGRAGLLHSNQPDSTELRSVRGFVVCVSAGRVRLQLIQIPWSSALREVVLCVCVSAGRVGGSAFTSHEPDPMGPSSV